MAKIFGLNITRAKADAPARQGGRRHHTQLSSGEMRQLRASYDLARTDIQNENHWAHADDFNAVTANSPAVRKVMRRRARYEDASNPYVKGIGLTHSFHVIGRGPRLQMLTCAPDLDRDIERAWRKWAKKVRLGGKLRTTARARTTDGEAFAMFITNPALPTGIKLDLQLIETEQIATPLGEWDPDKIDGIEFDEYGNPTFYWKLRAHPGGTVYKEFGRADRIPAEQMIHWFREDRAGQRRGTPELASSLGGLARLRRYSTAVISKEELLSSIVAIIETEGLPDAAPGDDTNEEDIPRFMDTLDFEPGTAVFMADGYKTNQLQNNQQAVDYLGYKHEGIAEGARPLGMPAGIALANSAGYNYSSARMDHQGYLTGVRIEEDDCETVVLDPILTQFLREGRLVYGWDIADDPPHAWFWDSLEEIDLDKASKGQERRLKNATSNLALEYADQGLDWEEQQEQSHRETERRLDDILKLATKIKQVRGLGVAIKLPGFAVEPDDDSSESDDGANGKENDEEE